MHVGRSYRFLEYFLWTRRAMFLALVVSFVPVFLYQAFRQTWLVVPWLFVLLVGTIVALMAGFKSTQAYSRTWEAQQLWASIAGKSLAWSCMCRDFMDPSEESRKFIYRHLAWLSALRYTMRSKRPWESVESAPNAEFRRNYSVPEEESSLECDLMKYLPSDEVARILVRRNKAASVLAMQGSALKAAHDRGLIQLNPFMEMQKALAVFHEAQSRSELIKDVPYPRQYAIVNTVFVRVICFLLPLGMIGELEKFNATASGFMHGNMVWLAIPLSVLISWMYLSLDQVGESTANPFEGGPNDVPIAWICRQIELDLRQLDDEAGLSELNTPESDFVL